MRQGITFEVTAADRVRMEAIVTDRNSPQKHVWRARIILLTGNGVGTNEIERQASVDKNSVWRWQERFMAEGVDGLLRDKTQKSRIPPLGDEVAAGVVAMTLKEPAGRDNALDGGGDGQSSRHQRQFGAAHMAKTEALSKATRYLLAFAQL
jgi:hypothetical protein